MNEMSDEKGRPVTYWGGMPDEPAPSDAQIWRCVSCGFEDTKPLREGVNNHWRKGYRPGKPPRSQDAICYAELKPVTDPSDAPTPLVDALLLTINEERTYQDNGPVVDLARQLEREAEDLRRQVAEARQEAKDERASFRLAFTRAEAAEADALELWEELDAYVGGSAEPDPSNILEKHRAKYGSEE